MKISELIKSLEYSKKVYGDIDIEFNFEDIEGIITSINLDKDLYFNYCQNPIRDYLSLQNFPY